VEPARALEPRDHPLVDQVVRSVRLVHRDGRHELSLRLDPPELGAIRIEATLEGRQLALAIHADREPARAALEQALPQLRESLIRHGLVPDRVTVQLGLEAAGRDGADGGARRLPPPPPAIPRPTHSPVAGLSARREAGPEGIDLWV
jgi:hypothetical protein